jgi:acetolactate synthase I/II/III large subunit
MTKLTGAQVFVECLKQEDVEFVFGVPGGQTLSITNALYDTSIRFITARHEGAASHMADGYGRITGKPGIALATTGPGATNMITGVGGAHRDSSPVVVVTCNNRRRHMGLDDNQDADHIPLFAQFTKWSRFVPDAEGVAQATREAFRVALSGNPGPVHLDFARDAIEGGGVDFEPLPPSAYRSTAKPRADDASIAAAFDVVLSAERPVIWAGNGATLSGAGEALLALARALGAPVVTTYNGIGAVPGNDPLVFGPRSRFGTKVSKQALTAADCVLAVGVSMNAASTSRWTLPLPRKLVQVDLEPTIIGRHYPVVASVVGDARHTVESMVALATPARLSARKTQRTAWLRKLNEFRTKWRQELAIATDSDSTPIKPQRVMRDAGQVIDANTIVVADAGNPGIWTHLLALPSVRSYMKPVGFGNMAFGVPAAIAAKLARPDSKVLLFVGDGSLGMSLAEIETAVREKTPIAIVVLNDVAYGNIKQEELHYFGPGRYIGVDFTDVRYADVAKAMGAAGERVTNPRDVQGAIARALDAGVPYVVDVMIDPAQNVWDEPI